MIYAPREGVSLRTSSSITEEIIKAKDKHQNINNSNFNGKLGHKIHGNMSTVRRHENSKSRTRNMQRVINKRARERRINNLLFYNRQKYIKIIKEIDIDQHEEHA